jgi:1-acyl-sn-glycerol-3-phosphate acyltransferase
MVTFRSIVFNIFFPLWTLLVALICTPLLFGSQKTVALAGSLWARGTLIALRVICGIKLKVKGREHLPAYPFIIACKHQSAFETIMFHIIVKAPVYVLKQELLNIPFFGQYLRFMGMIAIDRSGKAAAMKDLIRQSHKTLQAKRPIIIFPEGTRTAPGERIPYHPGIAALYSQSHAPVVPAALNSGKYWGKGAFLKKPGTIVIQFLPAIYPGLKRGEFMHLLEEQIETASDKLMGLP